MKLLMLSRDPEIFREGSEARGRMVEYGGVFEELHIIVALRPRELGIRNHELGISKNVKAYRTSWFSLFKTATSIIHNSRFIIRDSFITSQDPFELGFIGYLLKRKFKIPLQLQAHTDFLSPYFARESFKNRIRVALAKWLIKKADSVRVVSERIRKSLIAQRIASDKRIATLPIFVDIQKIKKAPVVESLHQKYPGRFIILMASRLTREKNITLALAAMRALKAESLAVRPLLVIVGDGPERTQLTLHVSRFKIHDMVVFEPRRDDLVSYYKTADLFLLTSNYEGYGRTVVEAAAAGLSVVMTNVGCAGEVIKDGVNGFIVPVGDKQALAEKLGAILRKPKLLEPLRRASLPELPTKKEYLAEYENTFHHPKS